MSISTADKNENIGAIPKPYRSLLLLVVCMILYKYILYEYILYEYIRRSVLEISFARLTYIFQDH